MVGSIRRQLSTSSHQDRPGGQSDNTEIIREWSHIEDHPKTYTSCTWAIIDGAATRLRVTHERSRSSIIFCKEGINQNLDKREGINLYTCSINCMRELWVDITTSRQLLHTREVNVHVCEPSYCPSLYQRLARRLHNLKLSIYSSSGFSTLLSRFLIHPCMIRSVNIYSLNSSPMNSISSRPWCFRLLGGAICVGVTRWLLVVIVGDLASPSMALATARGWRGETNVQAV
jgi:hypothetical protein